MSAIIVDQGDSGKVRISRVLTTRALSDMTGMSVDYFQKRARLGEIPCRRLGVGPRAIFVFDEIEFEAWWANELREVDKPCRKGRSASAGKSGTAASPTTVVNSKDALKQAVRQSRVNALQTTSRS